MSHAMLPQCIFAFLFLAVANGCTNILVTPGAALEGVALLGYNDDSSRRHGLVTHFPASENAEGSMRSVYDYDSGSFLGEIAQPAHTYNVMGNANEVGVVIGETTHGGLAELTSKTDGYIMDYGSLIYTTLQRASTAREAIALVDALTAEYGYFSSAEGFSITDGHEMWLMEVIGKGSFGKGLVWVAKKVPDGYITAHANQGRITTFLPCDDPSTCLMAADTVSFAIERGYFQGAPDDTSFSFSDTYDPLTASGARFCEARVWYIFSQVADPSEFDSEFYLDYAQGFNLTNRMPLFVKPKQGLTRRDLHTLLSSHFEGSWFDPSNGVGAGAEHSPYRWNGLTWQVSGDNATYVNERVVGTQYQAWHFVAQVLDPTQRPDVMPGLRALSWWGADEHTWAPQVPLFGGATTLHVSYDDGNCSARLACRQQLNLPGSMLEFDWNSAFWVNSAVAKQVYAGKDSAQGMVVSAKQAFESWVAPLVNQSFADAQACYDGTQSSLQGHGGRGGADCSKVLDALAVAAGGEATKRWTDLWAKLMVTYADGMVASADASNELCGCAKTTVEFTDDWLAQVVADAPADRYTLPECPGGGVPDPDGHCQPAPSSARLSAPEPIIAREATPSRSGPIPKLQVAGI